MGAGTGAEPDVRHARGVAAYARIFGVPEDQLAAAFASRVGPVFAEEQLQAAGGAAWADPALSGRDRSVAIITAPGSAAAGSCAGGRRRARSGAPRPPRRNTEASVDPLPATIPRLLVEPVVQIRLERAVRASGALAKLAGMVSPGLRERKKERTRRHIADTAARLFAERGYEQVAVTDVARAAEVAEQTVYNYFPTKEHLVTDREGQIQDRLCELIRSRPPGTTAATAIRDFVLTTVADIRDIPPELWRGELGYLAAISPAVHRLALELTDRLAAALAAAVSDSTAVPPEIARLQGTALASVFQVIISESGRRTREGQSQAEIADELYPIVENLLDELDRWLSVSGPFAARRDRSAAAAQRRPRRQK